MKNKLPKYLALLLTATVISIVAFNIYTDFTPSTPVSKYYQMLTNKGVVMPGESISVEDEEKLKNCKEDYNCFLQFFYSFSLNHTLEESLSKLTYLIQTHPEYSPNCHFIMHGIGKGEYAKSGENLGVTLDAFSSQKYFTNMATCGTGYYHGVIEEAAKDVRDKESLATMFQNVCAMDVVKKTAGSDCIHGLGHAAFIQTDYNYDDSRYICNQVAKTDYERFNCYTGIYMEGVMTLPQPMVMKEVNGSFEFTQCRNAKTDLENIACYYETSMRIQDFNPNKKDFSWTMKECSKISNDLEQIACIKNTSMRSIADVGYTDVKKLCLQSNLSTKGEIMCMAVYGHRLALSITGAKNEDYYQIADDICKNLSLGKQGRCDNIVKNNPGKLFLVSAADLNI